MKNNYALEVEIDDIYSCPGNCKGCVLSLKDRRGVERNKVPNRMVEHSMVKLKEYIKSLSGLEKIDVTFGIGDHFLEDKEYLLYLYESVVKLIEDAGLLKEKSNVYFSASLISKTEILQEKIDFLKNAEERLLVPVRVIIVLDPKNLKKEKISKPFLSNIKYIYDKFGGMDLAINLSDEAVALISPEELHQFCVENSFSHVAVNWVPVKTNINDIYLNQSNIADWLIEFDVILKNSNKLTSSYRSGIKRSIDTVFNKKDAVGKAVELDLREEIKSSFATNKNVLINKEGNIFRNYEAVGDVVLNNESAKIGSVFDRSKTIDLMLLQANDKIEKLILKELQKKPCVGCEFNKVCAINGFYIYGLALNKSHALKGLLVENIKTGGCPHVAKKILLHYKKELLLSGIKS